jgi:hypothetical protein
MASDLRERSKSPITRQMDEATAHRMLKDVQNEFLGNEAKQEMVSQKSVYEKGRPGAETGHTVAGPKYLETPDKYAKQIESLKEDLNKEQDPNNRANIVGQLSTLMQLIRQMEVVTKLSDAFKNTPEDQVAKQKLDEATEVLDKLRAQRASLQRKLSNFILRKEQQQLTSQINAFPSEENLPEARRKEKQWLEEKIKLLEVRMSNSLRKRDEIKSRKALINALGIIDPHGDFQPLKVSDLELMTFNRAIALGKDKILSKADYDRSRTEAMGREQKRDYVPVAPAERGGGRAPLNLDYSTATFPAKLKQFRDLNNTAMADSRKYIMRPNEKGDPTLKPFVEAISLAIRNKDKQGQYRAVNELRAATANTLVKSSSLQGYIQCIRLAPHFKKVEEDLFALKGKQDENGKWNLSQKELEKVQVILEEMGRIRDFYNRFYQNPQARKFREQPYAFYKNVTKFFSMFEEYIKNNMLRGITLMPQEYQQAPKYRVEVEEQEEATPQKSREDELRELMLEQQREEESEGGARKRMKLPGSKAQTRMKFIARILKNGKQNDR